MKTEEIKDLESYFKTNNEHWNSYTFEMLCEVLEDGLFKHPGTALRLFDDCTNIFTQNCAEPLKALQEFDAELAKNKLNLPQMVFVSKWVLKFLRQTCFEEIDMTKVNSLLKIQNEKLESKIRPARPAKDIREELRQLVEIELDSLATTLRKLQPAQRLNILCKLLPFVLSKPDVLDHTDIFKRSISLNI